MFTRYPAIWGWGYAIVSRQARYMAPSKRKLAPNADRTAPDDVSGLGGPPRDIYQQDLSVPVGNFTGRVRWASYEHAL
jgi:hypothetical protein